jgi:SAM-dependent methyltransferase
LSADLARRALVLPAFAWTIAVSAFLLFSVEPLVGRLTLPSFGGTPAVWSTVLFFFQAVLLGGYAYGHLSVTRLGPRRGAVVHLVLVSVALGALMVAPARIADLRDVHVPAVVNLLWILIVSVGPAAFAITATTPLLSAWFAAVRSADGQPSDPYWLYALSNAGSFAALLAYPFIIEPAIGLTAQRTAWTIGIGLLLACLAVCAGFVVRRVGRTGDAAATAEVAATETAATSTASAHDPAYLIDWRRRARWLLLAAVPSGLLSAVTNFITTDLISAPLLWVVPLAIYLLTFTVAFSERGRRIVPRAEWLAPAAITLLWVPFGSAAGWPIVPLLLVEFVGLGIVATTLHGRLATDRPPAERLTEFYLVLSLGGVLASSLVAVVAPILFKGVWEYPLLLVLALGALAVTRSTTTKPTAGPTTAGPTTAGPTTAQPPTAQPPTAQPPTAEPAAPATAAKPRFDLSPFFRGARWRVGPYVAASLALGLALAATGSLGLEAGARWLLVGGLILLVGAQPRFLFVSTALVLALAVFVLSPAAIFRDRSFFGVTLVLRPPGSPATILMNGTTVHGIQSTDPALRRVPGSYYAPHGPLGDVFGLARRRPVASAGQTIGVVGLGSGTIAAYDRPGDRLTFFEIDPLVIRVASDPTYFTWLSDAAVGPGIVLGDARLSLADVSSGTFDVLVLDAFSSDAIPAHLLTTEALADDARVLRPGGLLAIQVSNRYYDLAPAVASAARAAGLTVLQRVYVPTAADSADGAALSHWLIATTDPTDLPTLAAAGWQPVRTGVMPLTDDHPDLLRLLRIGLW